MFRDDLFCRWRYHITIETNTNDHKNKWGGDNMKKYKIRKNSIADKLVGIALNLKWNWKMYLLLIALVGGFFALAVWTFASGRTIY